jgi:hypothetical protein
MLSVKVQLLEYRNVTWSQNLTFFVQGGIAVPNPPLRPKLILN